MRSTDVYNVQEVKKSGLLKTQLEAYKRQVQDLQLKSTDEAKRADKAEFEAKRHQEKATVLALDKEVKTDVFSISFMSHYK